MALPQTINHQDHLLTVNIHEQEAVPNPADGSLITPLFLDPENGVWVLYAKFKPGTLLPQHFHTGTVHFFTTKGTWNYVEYPDDVQTAGSYLYEPGGSIHQFMVPEDSEDGAEGFMVVYGANVNFDDDGNFTDIMDAGSIEAAILAVCQAMGRDAPNYIKPGAGAVFSQKPAIPLAKAS